MIVYAGCICVFLPVLGQFFCPAVVCMCHVMNQKTMRDKTNDRQRQALQFLRQFDVSGLSGSSPTRAVGEKHTRTTGPHRIVPELANICVLAHVQVQGLVCTCQHVFSCAWPI